MNKTNDDWTRATTSVSEALVALCSCLESYKNAWIEIRKNGDQKFPIMKKNPSLENPFNWTMDYGTLRNEKELKERDYFNDTEQDLTNNWIAVFGTSDAIKEYQEKGTISKRLFMGSVCHPIKISDANYYREHIEGDNYKYGDFVTYWKPKDDIQRWVVDEDIKDVFVICYNDESVDKKLALKKAAEFLNAYAETI